MPELAEKTPIYDVLVYVVNTEKPVVIAERVLIEVAQGIQSQFHWRWPGTYGSQATCTVGNRLFVLNNVAWVEIKHSQDKVYDNVGRWVTPYWKDAFLEDDMENNHA